MNLRQHVFVTEYLRSADHIMAYKNAYNSTSDYTTIESAANRLLRQPEIAKAIADTQTAIRLQVEEELKAELKQELLTIQQKRELLAKIATGQIYTEQSYRGKNCSQCTQFVKPTINQMLKAIDLDNKLAGHYNQKPKEINHTAATAITNPPVEQVVSQQSESISPLQEPVLNSIQEDRGTTRTPATQTQNTSPLQDPVLNSIQEDRGNHPTPATETENTSPLQEPVLNSIQEDRGTPAHTRTLPLSASAVQKNTLKNNNHENHQRTTAWQHSSTVT